MSATPNEPPTEPDEEATPSEPLRRLAAAYGVATDYWDWQGRHAPIHTKTVVAVLAALDVAAGTPEAVDASLDACEDQRWRRTLPPTVVAREGWTPWVAVHVPHGTGVRLTVELEDGAVRDVRQVEHLVAPRSVDGAEVGEATFELPGNLPLGWHRLVAHLDASPLDPTSTEATLVVTPKRLELPAGLAARPALGLTTQLYQVRSSASWGVGDLADLGELGAWAADEHGADFVLVNPLHAAEPVAEMEPSPYLPTTRRFLNPLYLRVEDIPEARRLDAEDRVRFEAIAVRGRALNAAGGVDRDASWRLKRVALGLVHAVGLRGARGRDYRRFLAEEGAGLTSYATWCAIAEKHGLPWSDWPEGLQDPRGEGVARFQADNPEAVDLHCWLQWVLAEQVRAAQATLRRAGMRLGLIEDLAVGVHEEGSDAWSLSDTLAVGVKVGAPPDQFNQLGQDWGQPPWRPDRLAQQGYRPFRDMVRTALRDSAGVRIDHIIGLFRLWWIPAGLTPDQGAYVRYDHEALIGILALEAHRAGAVVIGEDLGVVEPSARDYLLERGVLGTSILWFEWDDDGPRPPEAYRELCLSSVTTHDLPPTAGYLALEHVAIRERLGLLTRTVEEEQASERLAIDAVRHDLVARGLLAEDAGPGDMLVALHRWLASTPSRMLAVALADLVGDKQAVNQPGTIDEYPNWRVALTGADGAPVTLDDITGGAMDDLAAQVFGALGGH
ncbi:MAG: 4-alpha-glucanotransferase [Actinomycetota bacterium]|nr:4-alpha-glucanotransferase [Actinomycetota bacterium]